MTKIKIHKVNDVFVKIEAEQSVQMELADTYSFFAHNYKFNPQFKNRIWDGKIRLFNSKTKNIYKGLVDSIKDFAEARNYEVELQYEDLENNISVEEFLKFVETLKLPDNIKIREYQAKAIIKSLRKKRLTLLSPTASGKSLIIYTILRYINAPSLLIVPTTSLVSQMYDDFASYAAQDDDWDPKEEVSKIMGGYSKEDLNPIVISTWQSLQKVDKSWFENNGFKAVLVDEVHTAVAKVLGGILERCENVPYRYGFTGSINDGQISELTLTGLFGPIKQVIETKELIEQKFLSEINIKACVLQYSDMTKKVLKGKEYKDEIDFLISNNKRNNFITNLSLSLSGNTLILFNFVEKHGKVLYEKLLEKCGDEKKIFFVSGEISGDVRNEIRKTVDELGKDCIIVASYQTFSTGINVVNLHNIIFAHPTKAKIRIIQSIGRGLRKGGEKFKCVLFDISDDLRSKAFVNYSYKHLIERLKIYKNQGFPYKLHQIELEKNTE